MKHLPGSASAVTRCCLLAALAALLVACGGKAPVDSMDAARAAIEASADAEPCAEAEYRAAANLLQQAEESFARRDYQRARQLADAAAEQAAYAREVALANEEDCNRVQEITTEVEERREIRDMDPVETDYEFTTVHFDFDAATLTADAQQTLNGHAEQLVRNPDWRMQVEGHCDTRGTTQYNLALGDRRARAVRDYLIRMGVEPDHVSTVSYGAEVPVSSDHRQNRRAEFQVRR